jgi:hypothetical protein
VAKIQKNSIKLLSVSLLNFDKITILPPTFRIIYNVVFNSIVFGVVADNAVVETGLPVNGLIIIFLIIR